MQTPPRVELVEADEQCLIGYGCETLGATFAAIFPHILPVSEETKQSMSGHVSEKNMQ